MDEAKATTAHTLQVPVFSLKKYELDHLGVDVERGISISTKTIF